MDPVHFKNGARGDEKQLTSTTVTPYGKGYEHVSDHDDYPHTAGAVHRPGASYAHIPDQDDQTLARIGYQPVCEGSLPLSTIPHY